MDKKTKGILLGASAVAAGVTAVAVVSHAITKVLLKVALDREQPKKIGNMKRARTKLCGIDDKDIFSDEMQKAAKILEETENEIIEIVGEDGVKLVAHWIPCENPQRIIIAMHGWRSSWSRDFGAISAFWHDNNCSVLYVEQRGQNNSGGDYMGFGLIERHDCLEWINWVNENKACGMPIYLGGVSMGAATVLMAAGLELPDNVKGIVADCGFTSPHDIWRHVVKNNLGLSFGIRGKIANDMCKKKINVGSREYSALDAMKISKTPVLFIHGTDDHFVPIDMTFQNYKACIAPKRLLVVPGAEHGMSYFVDKEAYESAVLKFWEEFQ